MLVITLDEEERIARNRDFDQFPCLRGDRRPLQPQVKVEVPKENGSVGDYPRSTEVDLTFGYSYSDPQTVAIVRVEVRQFALRFEEAA